MKRGKCGNWLLAGIMAGLMAGCVSQGQGPGQTASAESNTAAVKGSGSGSTSVVKRSSGPIAANRAIPADSPFARINPG